MKCADHAHVWGEERNGHVLSAAPGPVRFAATRSYHCTRCDAWLLAGSQPIRTIVRPAAPAGSVA